MTPCTWHDQRSSKRSCADPVATSFVTLHNGSVSKVHLCAFHLGLLAMRWQKLAHASLVKDGTQRHGLR